MKKRGALERETESTIKRAYRLVPKDRPVGKGDFEAILAEVMQCVHRFRRIGVAAIAEKTEKILTDLPKEYGQLPKEHQSLETLIGYLYAKYLKELGKL